MHTVIHHPHFLIHRFQLQGVKPQNKLFISFAYEWSKRTVVQMLAIQICHRIWNGFHLIENMKFVILVRTEKNCCYHHQNAAQIYGKNEPIICFCPKCHSPVENRGSQSHHTRCCLWGFWYKKVFTGWRFQPHTQLVLNSDLYLLWIEFSSHGW